MGVVERTWDEYWGVYNSSAEWDDQSEIIYRFIRREYTQDRMRVLEVGSGTGRISATIGRDGHDVYLVDMSPNAFRISRDIFSRLGQAGRFIRATAFQLPFLSRTFDLVWSAGLLEHFSHNQQRAIVNEMARITRARGRILVIVPNRRAIVYDLARRISMRLGTWPYGPEQPLCAEDLRSLGFQHISSGGRYYQLNFLDLLPKAKRIIPNVVGRVRLALGDAYFDTKGSFGYLLCGSVSRDRLL